MHYYLMTTRIGERCTAQVAVRSTDAERFLINFPDAVASTSFDLPDDPVAYIKHQTEMHNWHANHPKEKVT